MRIKPATIAGRKRLLAYTRDISAAKAAEEALRASEEQYRAIFNASDDALVLWNSRLEHVDVNAAHERMFGYAREETLGKRALPGLTEEEAEQRRSTSAARSPGSACASRWSRCGGAASASTSRSG